VLVAMGTPRRRVSPVRDEGATPSHGALLVAGARTSPFRMVAVLDVWICDLTPSPVDSAHFHWKCLPGVAHSLVRTVVSPPGLLACIAPLS